MRAYYTETAKGSAEGAPPKSLELSLHIHINLAERRSSFALTARLKPFLCSKGGSGPKRTAIQFPTRILDRPIETGADDGFALIVHSFSLRFLDSGIFYNLYREILNVDEVFINS